LKQINSVCVYCGSSVRADKIFQEAAYNLGKLLAQHDIVLVYGGGKLGLMGLVADGALENGGKAVGFIPEYLDQFEGAHKGLDELHIVDSMHTRKLKMSERAGAFVILPGGFGTLDEFFEILTWRQLEMHDKPIILVNINGYWDPLIALIKQVVAHKFADKSDAELAIVVSSIEEIVPKLRRAPESQVEFASQLV
jgi:uncharacterized protein (TIGR00730 family)